MKKIVIPEKIIQKQILQFLTAYGIFVFRVNVYGIYSQKFQGYRKLPPFSMRGMADILGILPGGRFLAIEVKTTKGKQSIWQKHFEDLVKRAGGIYILARSVNDVRFLVNEVKSA